VEWLDASGAAQPLLSTPAYYMNPKISPDGTRLAVAIYSGKGPELYSWDLVRGAMTRLTFAGQSSLGPVWTPDGKHIVFYYSVAGGYAIGWIRSDGAGEVHTLLQSQSFLVPYSFSPDGRRLAYYEQDPQTNRDLWTLPLDLKDPEDPKPLEPQPFLRTAFNELDPVFSPDGRWITYASDESGPMQLYVRPFPGPGGKWQISSGGGEYAFWSPNGREMFYETLDNRIMSVPFEAHGNSFSPGKPVLWSSKKIKLLPFSNLDLHPDGKRFAVFAREQNFAALHLEFRLNFFDEVARRAPRSR
jgi:serine/threonine-protein kinase